ncbi:MAG: hypothetical protein ACKVOW_02895 [Chitinophagaceae bacterium]
MKKYYITTFCLLLVCVNAFSQGNNGSKVERTVQKVENTVNRVKTLIEVFQPYLLKAKELFGQGKQLVTEVKTTMKSARGNKNNSNDVPATYNASTNNTNSNVYDPGNASSNNSNSSNSNTNETSGYIPPGSSNNNTGSNNSTSSNNNNNSNGNQNSPYGIYENYSPKQYLPINNEASINNDGSGNWGNQSNGLYGNCLDVLTGTIMGMGEAEDNPNSIDLMFFAPSDGQNTYVLMTPSFAKNNGTATYMTQHASDAVNKWKDVTESEVALTRLTISQFEKIQNNSQISSAVKNAVNYAGWYTSVGNKLEGQVFAVKVEQENRTVYALVAIVKHFGTSGSNGYLKIKVKSQGIDNNGDGYADPNAYIR